MQVAVAATPEVAIPTLDLLLKSGIDLQAIITRPDRPAGRGLELKESPVARWAVKNRIEVFKPSSQEELAKIAVNYDLVVTIGFGMIIQEEILSLPKFGFINLHFSLLPRWRGAAPVQRAIEAGDLETGVTVFRLDKGMDTGPIYRQVVFPITSRTTSQSLFSELAYLGAKPVLETITAIFVGEKPKPQISQNATRALKLTREEGRIDWTLPTNVIDRKVRAFYPNPGSWTNFRGRVIKIHQIERFSDENAQPGVLQVVNRSLVVASGDGLIKIVELQPAGKPVMAASAWLNGVALANGDRFE